MNPTSGGLGQGVGTPHAPDALNPGSVVNALADNPDCRLGLFASGQRVVYAEHGPNSFGGGPELLVFIARRQGYWYGQVARLAPGQVERVSDRETAGEGDWVAQLVPSDVWLDGETVDELLGNIEDSRVNCGTGIFDVYERIDGFALRPTFEAACEALAEIIRRFRVADRYHTAMSLEGELPDGYPDRRHETRSMLNALYSGSVG